MLLIFLYQSVLQWILLRVNFFKKTMKTIKKFYLLNFSTFVRLCWRLGGFSRSVRGSKKTTDEYLIKEKDPLILPPDFKNLPLPDSKTIKKSDTIESILTKDDLSGNKSNKKSPLETSIEEELRKNMRVDFIK